MYVTSSPAPNPAPSPAPTPTSIEFISCSTRDKQTQPIEKHRVATGMEFEVPPNVSSALMSGDPKRVFEACAKHYQMVVVAMATDDPYHGAPVQGFCPKINGATALMNGFCIPYFDKNTNCLSTRYVGLNELIKIKHTCMSSALAMSFKLPDPSGAATEAALKQMNAVQVLLKQSGVQ